jgi:hypothetical protein
LGYGCRVLTVPIVLLRVKQKPLITIEMESAKRTIQVNVKMSTTDFGLLQKAAEQLWPDAIISNSGIVLGLAKLAAKDVLARPKPKKR